jgi:hypothetical protein
MSETYAGPASTGCRDSVAELMEASEPFGDIDHVLATVG